MKELKDWGNTIPVANGLWQEKSWVRVNQQKLTRGNRLPDEQLGKVCVERWEEGKNEKSWLNSG